MKTPARPSPAFLRYADAAEPVLPCTPCQPEGCERGLDSYSQCLDELSPQQVIAVVDQALR
jgi:ADP-heptose:LPS heptosyltransferase